MVDQHSKHARLHLRAGEVVIVAAIRWEKIAAAEAVPDEEKYYKETENRGENDDADVRTRLAGSAPCL